MKKKNIIASLAALGVLGLATAGLAASGAAANATSSGNENGDRGRGFGRQLSDEQKAEMEARRTEMESQRQAVEAALAAGDYQAWLSAIGENNPMAEKITAENFPQLVKAHNLQQEAREIMASLGLETGPFGPGGRHGGPMGMGLGAGMMLNN